MPDTVENKKFTLTNRLAVVIIIAVIGATFSATLFYSESKYQGLVSKQNEDRVKAVNKALSDYKREVARELQNYRNQISKDLQSQRKYSKELVEQEVGGLRNDVREYVKEIRHDQDEHNDRIMNLEERTFELKK